MDFTNIFQNIILSGVLGYISVSCLQDKNAISSFLSSDNLNYIRIIFGLIDYSLYFLAYLVLSHFALEKDILLIGSVIITVVLNYLLLQCYNYIWVKHKSKKGIETLTAKEQAFREEEGYYTRLDIFDFDGEHITSGYLSNFDTSSGLNGDLTIAPLESSDKKVRTEEETISQCRVDDVYLDTKNRLKFFISHVTYEDVAAPDAGA